MKTQLHARFPTFHTLGEPQIYRTIHLKDQRTHARAHTRAPNRRESFAFGKYILLEFENLLKMLCVDVEEGRIEKSEKIVSAEKKVSPYSKLINFPSSATYTQQGSSTHLLIIVVLSSEKFSPSHRKRL